MPGMSARRSIDFAIRDQLTDTVANGGLALPAGVCRVMTDGRPPADAGQYFYAIHDTDRQNGWLLGDKSTSGTFITISSKTSVPFDRIGTDQMDLVDELNDKAEDVFQNLFTHQWSFTDSLMVLNPGVMNRANTYLRGWPDCYGWLEASYPVYMSLPQPQRADWWSGTEYNHSKVGQQYSQGMQFCGLSIQIRMSNAVRMQGNSDSDD